MEINCIVTQNIVKALQQAGGQCFIVGGYVRDTLLGNTPLDIDVEVHGLSKEIAFEIITTISPAKIIGRFGVISLLDYNTEFALPRIERKVGNAHTDFEVDFITDGNLKLAAKRRDFTINSMMYNLQTGQLLDYYHGCLDLENKVLRHVSCSFSEDPLRVLRAVKFISRYNLNIAKETDCLCTKIAVELQYLPTSRVSHEVQSIFNGKYSARSLPLLTKYINCVFHQDLKQAKFTTNNDLNQILFYRQFSTPYLVLDFCSDSKKQKKNIKLVLDNYQLIKMVDSLNGSQKLELISKLKSSQELVTTLNSEFINYFKIYENMLEKYNGNYFMDRGFSGKQIKIMQIQKIVEVFDEL